MSNQFGGKDRIWGANAGLNYNVSKNLDTYLTAFYQNRQSSGEVITDPLIVGPSSYAVVMIGARRKFGTGSWW